MVDEMQIIAFFDAVRHDDLDRVVKILSRHPQLALEKDNGEAAIHFFAKKGDVRGIVILTDAKESCVNLLDKDGKTAAHYAASKGSYDVLAALLCYGSRLDIKDNEGNTALDLIKDEQKRVQFQNMMRKTKPGQLETIEAFFKAVQDKKYYVVKEFLDEYPGLVRKKTRDKITALHIAARNGDLDLVHLLLEKKADPNEKDPEGKTPVHYAAQAGHYDVVTYLALYGGYVSKEDKNGKIALDLLDDEEKRIMYKDVFF